MPERRRRIKSDATTSIYTSAVGCLMRASFQHYRPGTGFSLVITDTAPCYFREFWNTGRIPAENRLQK
jgi:hypothetical protein